MRRSSPSSPFSLLSSIAYLMYTSLFLSACSGLRTTARRSGITARLSAASSSALRAHVSTLPNAISGAAATAALHCDVVVVGGGHAGCEAAAAAARTGAQTILITQRIDSIGEMSCNPSIGGIGKGHLVREIDALDGIMARITDDAGIHFKMLNVRKGPAVRGPRAQADRDLYKAEMQALLGSYPNLRILEASVEDLAISSLQQGQQQQGRQHRIDGVLTKEGHSVTTGQIVITTGTFLRGMCYLGRTRYSAGRHMRSSDGVEPPSVGLALTLERLAFPLARLKTGTPPRLLRSTIDWDSLEKQGSDLPPPCFSYLNIDRGVKMVDSLIECAKTYTNERTHALVMQHSDQLPDYDGADGAGVGPRYCPSIFKKVQRFPDRQRHMIWLEPEGLNTDLVYPNGLSGPYPPDIQRLIVRSIPGLESCEIAKPGYDVEYDFVNPTSLYHTLETKAVAGLYLAGQICGTTGYEEAAAQGIVAGANAGLSALGRAPLIIGRDEGYIGVLVDDLVTRGTNEPYRMFTSRAEYRLTLRQDNADMRLTQKGIDCGIVSAQRQESIRSRADGINTCMKTLYDFSLPRLEWAARGGERFHMAQKDGRHKHAVDILSMPDVTLEEVEAVVRSTGEERGDSSLSSFVVPHAVRDTVEANGKYSNYLERQEDEMERFKRNAHIAIPEDLSYSREAFPAFSSEELEQLRRHRPASLRAAAEIQGVTPHAIIYLYNYISRGRYKLQREATDSLADVE